MRAVTRESICRRAMTFSLGLALVLPMGCQRRSAPGAEAAQVGFKNLRSLDVVAGTMPLEAEASGARKLQLLVNGQPASAEQAAPSRFSWDTKKVPDGLVEVSLRRDGTAVLAQTKVVVLNQGSEVFFKDGSGGKLVVPRTGYQEGHMRFHWDMGEGAKDVLALLSWTDPGFDLELALGQGMCPHHGTQLAGQHSTTSPISVRYALPPGQAVAGQQWFAHVKLLNEQQVLGRETAFTVKAYALH